MEAPHPTNETERLAALESYDILDSDNEAAFDDLVLIASRVCDAPIALVSLIDEDRQWFKARVGLDAPETPREHAFCAHAILADETLVVGDAESDPRFRDNPLVVGRPDIRFYAGAPMRDSRGYGLGTLCVIDSRPRIDDPLTPDQLDTLEALSRQAVYLLELRRTSAQLADALHRTKLLAPLVPVCAWCNRVRDDADYWSSIEEYLHEQAGVGTTHGICPTCSEAQEATVVG